MKKIHYILPVIILFCTIQGFAQHVFTPAEKEKINSKTDSILRLYEEYSQFTSDVDEDKLSEQYIEGFGNLFISPQAEVINDLDYTKKTPSRIPVSTYIDYVRQWFPGGLSTALKIKKKNPPENAGKNNYKVVVNTTKELKGLYKNDRLYVYKAPLNFVIQFNDLLSSFKITKIEDTIGGDSCKVLREMGNKYITKKDYKNARITYLKALDKYCPSDEISKAGLIVADSGIDANKKPVSLVLHLMPGYSMLNMSVVENIDRTVSSLAVESGFVYAGGLGLEFGLVKSSAGLLSVGLNFDYSMYSATLKSDMINESVAAQTDIDEDEVILIHNLYTLKEEDKISYLQIPVFIKYDLSLSKAIALYGKLGIKAGFVISDTYTTTVGTGEFMGQYPQYGNIILWGNELSEYGYGTYADLSASGSNTYLNSINLSALVGLGLKASLSKKIDFFLGLEYDYGFSDLGKTGGNYSVSTGKEKFNSLFGSSKSSLSAFSIDLGINIRIFRY